MVTGPSITRWRAVACRAACSSCTRAMAAATSAWEGVPTVWLDSMASLKGAGKCRIVPMRACICAAACRLERRACCRVASNAPLPGAVWEGWGASFCSLLLLEVPFSGAGRAVPREEGREVVLCRSATVLLANERRLDRGRLVLARTVRPLV